MHWLQSADTQLFRLVNQELANPVLDVVMPFLSGNQFFYPLLALLAGWMLWKGRSRGIVCVLMLAVAVSVSDGFICKTLKKSVARTRPFAVLEDVRTPARETGYPLTGETPANSEATQKPISGNLNTSMPSSHAANWFAAVAVAFIYYRRSLWLSLPAAILVSLSRVYNGVHYPSDVLVGAIVGAGTGCAAVYLLDAIWKWAGARWFPLWWEQFPSLLYPVLRVKSEEDELQIAAPPRSIPGRPEPAVVSPHTTVDQHWLRLGYVVIACLLLFRLFYISSDTIQLSEDEAYQWLWSKHLDLSYFSKPPLIAYTQFLGTSLWGDTKFGIRFFAPVLAAILSMMTLRFFAREVNARAGFFLLLIVSTTPMLSAGAVLMTIDPLSVIFWTAAMFTGWKAVGDKGTTRDWTLVGIWMGLGFLSKYTQLFQILCWTVFFVLWKPARKHLRRPGPYLGLFINLLFSIPVLIWNSQHAWITVQHVADNAQLRRAWSPTLRYLIEFIGGEAGLLNPVYLVAVIMAVVAFWRRGRHNPRLAYFFSMGAPLFLVYLLLSFRSRVLLNWIAPSVLPLLCLAVLYWDTRWRSGLVRITPWLTTGLVIGGLTVVFAHDTNLASKVLGRNLPVHLDPLHRVREWDKTAAAVGGARQALLAEGKPVFVICEHYGMTSQISFYLPDAKTMVTTDPLVFFRRSDHPRNQFFFWKDYADRQGQNAIYVVELDRKKPTPKPVPEALKAEFDSITELGITNVMYHKTMRLRPLQLFACRNLK